MKNFKLDNIYSIVCNWKNRRNGFKHTANLYKNGLSIYETKICYLNRTWERFEYESILTKVITKYFNDKEKENYLQVIKDII